MRMRSNPCMQSKKCRKKLGLVSSRMMMMMMMMIVVEPMMIVVEPEEVGVFGLRFLRLDSYVILSRTDLFLCVINALTERKSWIPTQVHNCGFFRLEFLFFWSYFRLSFVVGEVFAFFFLF